LSIFLVSDGLNLPARCTSYPTPNPAYVNIICLNICVNVYGSIKYSLDKIK